MDNSKNTGGTSKQVRVYQIEPLAKEYIYKDYGSVVSRGLSAPPSEVYRLVYDGCVGTDVLEEIFIIFNSHHPQGYKSRSLSVSDIVEIYDDNSSCFYYCDGFGYAEIPFKPAMYRYMLLSNNERDMNDPKFFNILHKAQEEMMGELSKKLDPLDDFTQDDDYGYDESSAWGNNGENFDWHIITLLVSDKGDIKIIKTEQEDNS